MISGLRLFLIANPPDFVKGSFSTGNGLVNVYQKKFSIAFNQEVFCQICCCILICDMVFSAQDQTAYGFEIRTAV